VVIWYIFSRFGILHQEKSGNPGQKRSLSKEKGNWGSEVDDEMDDLAKTLRSRGCQTISGSRLPDGIFSDQKS
jgi:hypothetical protein